MVTVTKQEAVRLMLRGALRACQSGDDICTLTLAGAAEGSMPIPERVTAYDVLRSGRAFFRNLTEKQAADELNRERNWLKHYNANEPDPFEIIMAETMMLRAMSRYMVVYGLDDLTREYSVHMGWPPDCDSV